MVPCVRAATLAILVAFLSPIAFTQTTAGPPISGDPVWLRVLLASGGAVAALLAFAGTLLALRAQQKRIDQEVQARLKAEARTEAARLRSRYVNALPFHATLLRDHLLKVSEKLAHPQGTREMAEWFNNIKLYGARKLGISAEEFSAHCHYSYVFAMSTLYYTSVFLFFSQRIRSLAPFSEIEPDLDKRLNSSLKGVSDAFVTGSEDSGLWETVQNSMGAIVKKDDWYISYPEFCRIFIDIEPSRRDDHVFMRALDFFGAQGGDDNRPSHPLLTAEGAKSIAAVLDRLLDDLRQWRENRGPSTRNARPA